MGKPIVAVRVLNLSDDEQIVREGTDIASCEVIDNVTVVKKTEPGTHKVDTEFPGLEKNVVLEVWTICKRTSCIRCWWNLVMCFHTARVI